MNLYDAHRLYDATRNLDGYYGRTDRSGWASFRFQLWLAECKVFKRYDLLERPIYQQPASPQKKRWRYGIANAFSRLLG